MMTIAARISTKKLQLGKLIGKGSFGQVHKGNWYNSGRWMRVAIKMVNIDISYEDVCSEANIMKELEATDSGVVICYGVAVYNDFSAIVMQHMALGKFGR